MIIETSCNHFYRVWNTGDESLAHVWYGIAVRRFGEQWIDKVNARTELVRKEASRVVEEGAGQAWKQCASVAEKRTSGA